MKKETKHEFVFITDYPFSARPFYHMKSDQDPNLTKSFDLLYKGIEITTGSQREHRPDILIKQAEENGMNLNELDGYFNFFKYGCPPHGGIGIGPARIIMRMLDLPNIREAVFLPRDVRRTKP
ncbi:MAG: amino acid--tRNA ligase-related protein [bacterium]